MYLVLPSELLNVRGIQDITSFQRIRLTLVRLPEAPVPRGCQTESLLRSTSPAYIWSIDDLIIQVHLQVIETSVDVGVGRYQGGWIGLCLERHPEC